MAEKLGELWIEAAAVLFLNCYRNADHELRAKDHRGENPACSSPPRTSCRRNIASSSAARRWSPTPTSVRGAAYIGEIEDKRAKAGFDGSLLIVQSTGGLYEAEQAKSQCVRMLEFGLQPA